MSTLQSFITGMFHVLQWRVKGKPKNCLIWYVYFFVVLWRNSINSFRNGWWLKSQRMSEFVSILQKRNPMLSVDRRVRNYFIWPCLLWPGVSFSSLLQSKSGATFLTSNLPSGYWGTRYCKGSISSLRHSVLGAGFLVFFFWLLSQNLEVWRMPCKVGIK